MSGEFAVRTIPKAVAAIERLKARREELRRYVRAEGNDPPEILSWTWSPDGAGAP
jgi:hypothetical protein